METHFEDAFLLLRSLYERYDFFYHLEALMVAVARAYANRSEPLKRLDLRREAEPAWFLSQEMVGAVCYVDRFAGTLRGLQEKIGYLKALGVTYLHLMPIYHVPRISDGGFAVSSYREINPALGTVEDLVALADALREAGISLVLDLVFNHTSDEHDWAKRALAGYEDFQDYYFMFPDRTEPDAYEQHLRAIFPETAPGSFTYRREIDRWVWTTFNPYQWDLNYRNPEVFAAMLEEILFLANSGAEALRLDAVPFIWKEKGTPCENLPPGPHAH
ncbi:MAG: amylosucrase, partial [Anaerolineae bacterium]|nr:amylosucrase [Anaerolineae bacterium]